MGFTWCTDTTSPNLTLKFERTTLFMRTLFSSTLSSDNTIQMVSFRFLPCTRRVLPLTILKHPHNKVTTTAVHADKFNHQAAMNAL